MTFPYAPARPRAAECKPSPRKGSAAPPAELPAQPPQPPKYRQFIKLAICLKAQVCKAPEIATKRRPKSPPPILPSRPSRSGDRRGDHRNGSRSSGGAIGNRADRASEERATGCTPSRYYCYICHYMKQKHQPSRAQQARAPTAAAYSASASDHEQRGKRKRSTASRAAEAGQREHTPS